VRIVCEQLLLSFQGEALHAAEGSVAAGRQGKCWEIHDPLF